jgi:hypothetical protein
VFEQVSTSTGTLQGTPWFRFDDERVYQVEASEALVENFGTGSSGHRRNLWNWKTIKYGRTACMLFYVRRSAAAEVLASGAAASAVQTSITRASSAAQSLTNGGAAAAALSCGEAGSFNCNAPTQTNCIPKNTPLNTSSSDIQQNGFTANAASNFHENCAHPLHSCDNNQLRMALARVNRLDALSAFRNCGLDDASIDMAEHEQHLDYLGMTAEENSQFSAAWRSIRGSSNVAPVASQSSPINLKLRSLDLSSSAVASSNLARSVVPPNPSRLPDFSDPGLTIQNVVEAAATFCVEKNMRPSDSDDDNDLDCSTGSSLQHLPSYIRAYHPHILSQLRAFHVSHALQRASSR